MLLGPRVGVYLTPIAGSQVDVRLSVRARAEPDAEGLLAELRRAFARDAA